MDNRKSNITTSSGDNIDDLFDYDVDMNDVFREIDTNLDAPSKKSPSRKAEGKENGAGLGIDEEIRITKKRRPVVKLDESRLLSQTGIPKLRRISKERLKFKGKGHEYSDIARLLNFYQLWLDDLYPRAKFADGLAIIEKLGHTKRMQTMRREWINDDKPKDTTTLDTNDISPSSPNQQSISKSQFHSASQTTQQQSQMANSKPGGDNDDLNERLRSTMHETSTSLQRHAPAHESLFVSDDEDTDQIPDDDLDALLAEESQQKLTRESGKALENAAVSSQHGAAVRGEGEFDDDLEAMAGIW